MMHLRGGHHDALAVIVDRYQRLVWSVAQKIVHDESEAEDCRSDRLPRMFSENGTFQLRKRNT